MINIITRFSRKDSINKCIKSTQNQTYKHINHIITYENDEDRDWLWRNSLATLVKVPSWKPIPNTYISYNHHDAYNKYLKPNLAFWDKKVQSTPIAEDISVDVEPIRYTSKEGLWLETTDKSQRVVFKHFPPNLYLKIAEQHAIEGWMVYLDDDDVFDSPTVLEEIVQELVDKDTLYLVKCRRSDGIRPSKEFWDAMDKANYPIMLNEVGSASMIYHSKYKDYTNWDEWRAGDFRTIKTLEEKIPNKKFIDKVLIDIT
tara:strand:+ start:696 stop:1469 length:774 start_codon:yes stop_codon:yes gene_type:complete